MKIKKTILLIVLCLFFLTKADGVEYYLLASFIDAGGLYIEPTILYRINDTTNEVEKLMILDEQEIPCFIQLLSTGNGVIVGANKTNVDNGACMQYKICDFQKPFQLREVDIFDPSSSFCKNTFIYNDSEGTVLSTIFYKSDESGHFVDPRIIGVNIETNIQKTLEWELFNHFIINSGSIGILQSELFTINLKIDNDGSLFYPSNMIYLNNKIPHNLVGNKKRDVQLIAQNEFVAWYLMNLYDDKSDRNKIEKEIVVFNKKESKWDKIYLPDDISSIKVHGHVLSGVIVKFGGYQQTPGKKENKNLIKMSDVDYLAKKTNSFVPGILYAYDAFSRENFQFNTQQGDSEILLIEGDKVYWRKYDEIYLSTLKNGTFENTNLLIKNDIVPGVHWIYCKVE